MDNWEKDLDARLKRLPNRRAPARLAAAVMLRAQPWHHRPWWTWNLAGRLAFVGSVAVGVVLLSLAARPLAQAFSAHVGWTFTLAAALGKAAGKATFVLIALAAVPTAALAYIKEKA
jgi:hypothetical protein